jgi:hypothetical protein
MLSRSRGERATQLSVGNKIKRRCHISAFRATREILPYLRIIFKNDTEMAVRIAKWLELESEMIGYLTGNEEKADAIAKLLS